jgi:hypothetical protein
MAMATMNFSIPDDVKEAFNKAFDGQNKSAVVADYLMRAVDDENRRKNDIDFLERMRARYAKSGRSYTTEEIKRLREDGRA